MRSCATRSSSAWRRCNRWSRRAARDSRQARTATSGSRTGGRSRSRRASSAAAIACRRFTSRSRSTHGWRRGLPTARGVVLDAGAQASLASLPAPAGRSTSSSGPKAASPPEEVAHARCARACARACGPRILRADTAALAALAAINLALGRLQMKRAMSIAAVRGAGRMHDVAAGAVGRATTSTCVLGPEGVPVARVITARAQCPTIEVDGARSPMTVRMPAETIPVRPSRSDLPPPKASAFPVTTCEATLPATATRASDRRRAVAAAQGAPKRIVMLGDTGCRIVSNFGIFQSCDDPIAWPFERVANAAAADATRSRDPRRRLSTTAKAPATSRIPAATAARGATVTTHGAPTSSSPRASSSPPRRGS